MTIYIRLEQTDDYDAIAHVNECAFGREVEANLVNTLRTQKEVTLSLVAVLDGEIVGHILFSPISIGQRAEDKKMVALGPLAVLPAYQQQCIGSQLVQVGLAHCRQMGVEVCVVLGHSNYYPRFGFVPAKPFGIHCEFPVPDEAFMARELVPNALANVKGEVKYASAFRQAS